ncbi:unnamed protein product [Prunus armeniaca]
MEGILCLCSAALCSEKALIFNSSSEDGSSSAACTSLPRREVKVKRKVLVKGGVQSNLILMLYNLKSIGSYISHIRCI